MNENCNSEDPSGYSIHSPQIQSYIDKGLVVDLAAEPEINTKGN